MDETIKHISKGFSVMINSILFFADVSFRLVIVVVLLYYIGTIIQYEEHFVRNLNIIGVMGILYAIKPIYEELIK